jgi:hypothetical protein
MSVKQLRRRCGKWYFQISVAELSVVSRMKVGDKQIIRSKNTLKMVTSSNNITICFTNPALLEIKE